MNLTNYSDTRLNSLGIFLFMVISIHLSFPLKAQINSSKGVPSYTNYVIGGQGGKPAGEAGIEVEGLPAERHGTEMIIFLPLEN